MATKGLDDQAHRAANVSKNALVGGGSTVRPSSGRLGTYALKYELGSGPLSTLYLAQRVDSRSIAEWSTLKVLRPELARRADVAEGFLEQAHKAASIRHPYVSQPRDVGTADGTPYVASEFLIAEPLARVQTLLVGAHAEVSVPYVVELIACAAEGLHAAHVARDDAGTPLELVHRNVSPRNLLAVDDGTLRVVDFGCSPTTKIRGAAPGEDAARGAYMSPEALKTRGIDHRSDIWSLGVVLWEMLAGRPLFKKGSEVRAVVAVLEAVIEPPSRYNAAIPSALDDIVMRALQRDRELRYGSAAQLASELRSASTRTFGPLGPRALGDWINTLFSASLNVRRALIGQRPPASCLDATGATQRPANDGVPALVPFGAIAEDDFSTRTIVLESLTPEAKPASSVPPGNKLASILEPEAATVPNERRVARFTRGLAEHALPAVLLLGLTSAGALVGVFWQLKNGADQAVAVDLPQAPSLAPAPALSPGAAAGETPAPKAALSAVEGVAAPTAESVPSPAPPSRERPAARPPSPSVKPGPRTAPASFRARTAGQTFNLGEVYVATQSKSVFVSTAGGREVAAPGKLNLPAGAQTIRIRHAESGEIEERSVTVFPGALVMVSVK